MECSINTVLDSAKFVQHECGKDEILSVISGSTWCFVHRQNDHGLNAHA